MEKIAVALKPEPEEKPKTPPKKLQPKHQSPETKKAIEKLNVVDETALSNYIFDNPNEFANMKDPVEETKKDVIKPYTCAACTFYNLENPGP